MNKETLLKEKEQLEQQREQAISTVQQLLGAIAMVDKLIKDLDTESKPEKDNKEKTNK